MASAQVEDLTGGVFIAHHDPDIVYSVPLEGWCQHYLDGYQITSCDAQNPTLPWEERIWFLLSAFPGGDKEWCGTEFGMGQFDPYCVVFTSWGPCAPGGTLEIPTAYWPGPGEGTSVVTTTMPWYGNWQPVYYFTSYAYYGYCQIPFDVDPPTDFAGWGNCLTPPESFDAACLPAMGVLMDGVECCPSEPERVCCVGYDCYITTETVCRDMGGDWHPEWDSCGPPNPCEPPPTGACCVGEDCYVVTAMDCDEMGGIYLGDGTDCGPPNPCLIYRVCCVGCDCYITTETECADMGGVWHPEWDSCEPNPCDGQSPADGTSWGTIKAIYR
jgi:hypothetical protein